MLWHILLKIINGFAEQDLYIRKDVLMDKPVKEWGKGIPQFTDSDVLKGMELHAFCANAVAGWMQENNYEIEGAMLNRTPTQIFSRKDGRNVKAIVAGAVYPDQGRISYRIKKEYTDYCLNNDAIPMFASVGIMSHDPDRAAAGLALKYDGYYFNFTGLVDLTNQCEPTQGTKEYEALCVEKIIEAYETGEFSSLYEMFSDDIELHSQWVKEPLIGKGKVKEYYDGKGKTIRESGKAIHGSVVMINKDHKRTGNVILMSEQGKLCAIMMQTINNRKNYFLSLRILIIITNYAKYLLMILNCLILSLIMLLNSY